MRTLSLDSIDVSDLSADQLRELEAEISKRKQAEREERVQDLDQEWESIAKKHNQRNQDRIDYHEAHKEAVKSVNYLGQQLRKLKREYQDLGATAPTLDEDEDGFVNTDPSL